MRKIIILALGLFMATGSIMAQDFQPSVYIGSGLGIPISSDIKDTWKSGGILEVGMGGQFRTNLEIYAKFSYSHFRPDEDKFVKYMHAYILEQTGEDHDINKMSFGGGGAINYYSFVVGAKYYIPASLSGGLFNPYFTGSAGFERQEIVNPELVFYGDLLYVELDMGSSEIGFLGNAGAGVDFNFGGGFSVFVEGKYALHFVDPKNVQTFPLTAGFKIALGKTE